MPFPGPGSAAASDSGRRVYRVCTVVSLLCFTYVRGPDLKAGLHFSIRAQVGEFQLGLVCVGISGGNLSRLPGSTRVGTWVPTLPRTKILVSGETVKGTCVSWKRILEVVAV